MKIRRIKFSRSLIKPLLVQIKLGIPAILLLLTFSINAADECGVAIDGGTITCDGDGIPVTDSNPYASGINYSIDGLTLDVNNAATDITISANKAVFLTGTGNNPIQINLANTLAITTDGGIHADAVVAKQLGAGAVGIDSNSTILTQGNDGEGLLGWINNATNNSAISINATGTIETQGINAAVIMGYTIGLGSVSITTEANLSSSQTFSDNVIGWIDNATSNGSISLSVPSGNLSTFGTFSPGIQAYNIGLGTTNITSSAIISTSGSGSHAISATHTNVNNTQNIAIEINGGSVLTTNSENAGIYADTKGIGQFLINLNSGSINSAGHGVHAIASSGGTLNIASNTTIENSLGANVIRNGDRNNDGIDNVGGNILVNSAGTLTGNIILGLGNDTFNFTSGTITGDFYADDVTASPTDGNDTFNWTGGTLNGGIFTGNGSDAVSLSLLADYQGNEIINGGDSVSTADTFIDQLTFNGINATVSDATLMNWEKITLDDSVLSFSGSLIVGNEATTGLYIQNNATLNSFSDFSITGNLNNANLINLSDGDAKDTLTINGDYTGTNSTIKLDTVLFDGFSDTDKIIITGNSAGATRLDISNIAGIGANTNANPILIVQVDGDSLGTFGLTTPLAVNGYNYSLEKIGNNWYLQGVAIDVDLSINKEIVTAPPYFIDDTTVYRLTITNNGPAVATNVVVSDVMTNLNLQSLNAPTCTPASFPCTIASLGVGASETIIVLTSFIDSGVFDNTASVSSPQNDTNFSNNADTSANGGTAFNPDMSISLNNCVSPLSVGQDLIYELTIKNEGDYNINGVQYESQLSAFLDISQWECMAFNGANCPTSTGTGNVNALADFPAGSSLSYLINAQTIGLIGDIVNSTAQVNVPLMVPERNTVNNFTHDIDALLDLIFGNGFDCVPAGN